MMDADKFIARLTELKAANMPHVTWHDVFVTGIDELPELNATNEYFSRFVQVPVDERGCVLCVCCGAILAGGLLGVLLGDTFRRTLTHGEGECRNCRWPSRALHYNVGPIRRLEAILQYHPDGIEWKPRPKRQEDENGIEND
jgi:hypothetical protein